MRASPVPVSCEGVCCKTLAHRAIDGWMLLLSALLMPCTPFRIGPTRIERELAELEQAAEQAGLDGVRLPFELDLVPAMFQHLLSTGALNRRHVLYQSVDRFCAEALGLESELTRADPSRYDTLLEFGKTLVSRFGRGANALLHGQGNASDLAAAGGGIASVAHTSSHEFVRRRNFGTFSNRTIQRSFPTVEHGSVLQMYDVLNLFISAQQNSSAIWHPVDGKTMIAIDVGIDGMLTGIGAMVDESALEVAGFERPIRPDEAERVANMDDAQLAAWLKENAFVKEAVEVMAMASDASVSDTALTQSSTTPSILAPGSAKTSCAPSACATAACVRLMKRADRGTGRSKGATPMSNVRRVTMPAPAVCVIITSTGQKCAATGALTRAVSACSSFRRA